MRSWIAGAVGVGLVGLAVAGCNENNHYPGDGTSTADGSNPGDTAQTTPPVFAAELEVRDEANAPVGGATVRIGDATFQTGGDGRVTLLNLDQPVLAVIEANGFLPEPVAVGRGSVGEVVSAQLLRETGPGGERRVVMHFGGDSMLGRRYTDPDEDGLVRVSTRDGGAQAREVVEALAPLFKAADIRALNFESLIGELPASLGYPRKRYLIQSPSATAIPALQELEANCVNLANNHLYDWLDPGVVTTLGALDSAGIPNFGAGANEGDASAPLSLERRGLKIGFLGYVSISGDVTNNALPTNASSVPADLDPQVAWKYELRDFGYSEGGLSIPSAPRRAGEAWRLFKAEEDGGLAGAELAAFWQALRATYPELQDIVARRGHGGPNLYDEAKLVSDIQALRSSGHDLVVVQMHTGYEYAEHKNLVVDPAAKAAIDAGADLFVGHHPHVTNGFEFYKGKLIANSLGNLVFDQNFLVTFTSVVLRVVFEEGSLLQARLYPLTMDDYRPAPVVDKAADYTLRLLQEKSVVPARAERDGSRRLYLVLRPDDPDSLPPDFVREGNSARLVAPTSSSTRIAVSLQQGEMLQLPGDRLVRSRAADGGNLGLEFARDLYGWGDFEDYTADGIAEGETHWTLTHTTRRVEALDDAPSGVAALRLRRVQANQGPTTQTPIARAPVRRVRYHTRIGLSDTFTPATDDARYSLRFDYRLQGDAPVAITLKLYTFRDLDPFAFPDTRFLREVTLPFAPTADGSWREAVLDVPQGALAPDSEGREPTFAIPVVELYPSSTPEAVLQIDQFQFLEWHTASTLPDSYFAVAAVRSLNGGAVTLEQR